MGLQYVQIRSNSSGYLIILVNTTKSTIRKKVLSSFNKTISDGGITVDFWFIKVHTSN